jgi:hypothetical protein
MLHSPVVSPPQPTPDRFILHVDGAGGYLVLTRPAVRFGPISSSDRPDVGLVIDPGLPTFTLQRLDEDCFLTSVQPVAVNGSPMTRGLIQPGSRIDLSARCRLVVKRPSPASTSIVIDLGSTRLTEGGVGSVILMEHELVIGPGSGGHIRVPAMEETVLLQWRDGQLVARTTGAAAAAAVPLPHDTRVLVGGVGMVVAQAA